MAKSGGKKKLNKFTVVILISMAVILVIAGFYFLPREYDFLTVRKFLHDIENLSLEWRFVSKAYQSGTFVQTRGTIHRNQVPGVYSKMTVFTADDESMKFFNSYPIDRKVWAKILDHFNASNPIYKKPHTYPPDLVLFDIFFNEPSPKPESDKAFAGSLSKFKQPVGEDFILYPVSRFHPALDNDQYITNKQDKGTILANGLSYDSPEASSLRKFELDIKKPIKGLRTNYKLTSIIKEISSNLNFAGAANIEASEPGDDIYCKNPLIISAGYYIQDKDKIRLTNVYYPSVVLSAAVKLLNSDVSNIVLLRNQIVIKNTEWNGIKGNFKIPVDDQYRLFINYKASPNSGFIQSMSVMYAENAHFSKDSIFIISVLTSGATFNKLLSPLGEMYSAEHIGYSLGTILNRDYINELPPVLNLAYIIIFTLVVCIFLSRGMRSAVLALLLSVIFPLLLGFILFQFNMLIITIIPMLTGVLALIIGEIYILLTEQREKRFIKSTFSKYVSPDLVNILVANPEKIELGGQDAEATVLFSDIRGFTTLSEGMQPNELINFLNSYLTKMTDIVMETKGTLDKYIGDAVVAFWGTPIELSDHALKACQAGLKMLESLHSFNEEQLLKGYKAVNIGIGLNTGCITVGNIGSEKKRNYTAIGDNMNLAEDLQDENKFYQTNIIISQFTYEQVKEWAIVRELDSIYVKGVKEPVKIYELLDLTKWE